MVSRTSNVGLFATGDVLTEAHMDALPAGWLGYAEKLTDTTGIAGTETTILTQAVSINASRLILITAYFPSWISTASGDRAQMRILEGGTQLQLGRSVTQNTGVATEPPSVLQRVLTGPTAGAHTYSMTIVRNTGTGTLTLSGDPTSPAFLLIQDVGRYP